MIQSLKKKEEVLDSMIRINQRQKEELDNPSLDPDDFDATFAEKEKLIEQLDTLDNGFQELFEKIREDLTQHQAEYRDEIAQMQECIRRLTAKSADIQTQETRNKALMEQKFASVRRQVKEVRKSQKIVNQYYKNMMKTNYVEPQNVLIHASMIRPFCEAWLNFSGKFLFYGIMYRNNLPIYNTSKSNELLGGGCQMERTAGREGYNSNY